MGTVILVTKLEMIVSDDIDIDLNLNRSGTSEIHYKINFRLKNSHLKPWFYLILHALNKVPLFQTLDLTDGIFELELFPTSNVHINKFLKSNLFSKIKNLTYLLQFVMHLNIHITNH